MNRCLVFILFFLFCIPFQSEAVRRALVFGLGKQLDSRWGKIHGDNDIPYVVKMLRNMEYTDIKTLCNEQATKNAMVKALVDLTSRCKKGDWVYIHYSGHGQLMTDLDGDEALKWRGNHAGWDEAWIPYDAYMTYCKQDRGEKHFCDDEIANYLSQIRKKISNSGQLVVVVDACHSGDATSGNDDECIRGIDIKFTIPQSPNTPKRTNRIVEKWQTISACKPYQLSAEIKGKEIGKLTFALYILGRKRQELSNASLTKVLTMIFEKYKGRLKQTPMVMGKK